MANQNDIQHDFQKVNRDQLITVQDLIDFKQQLIIDIKKLLKEQSGHPGHQWLKAFEIKKCFDSQKVNFNIFGIKV